MHEKKKKTSHVPKHQPLPSPNPATNLTSVSFGAFLRPPPLYNVAGAFGGKVGTNPLPPDKTNPTLYKGERWPGGRNKTEVKFVAGWMDFGDVWKLRSTTTVHLDATLRY